MAKEWDKANMRALGVNIKRDTADAFKEYAKKNDTTVGALLRGYVEAMVSPQKTHEAPMGVMHLVSYKNTDLLKAEVAHHNPDNLNPDEMLNRILDEYFRFVKKVRQ